MSPFLLDSCWSCVVRKTGGSRRCTASFAARLSPHIQRGSLPSQVGATAAAPDSAADAPAPPVPAATEKPAAPAAAKAGEEAAAAVKAEGEEAALEEGEIPPSPAEAAAAAAVKKPDDPRVVAEQERQARRRMLGNMQFIGQLYKCGLLTERIMHNCVQQLLQVGDGIRGSMQAGVGEVGGWGSMRLGERGVTTPWEGCEKLQPGEGCCVRRSYQGPYHAASA